MRQSKKFHEKQTTTVYDEYGNPSGGGRGWQLPDLNVPPPPYHPVDLTAMLVYHDVQCEFPECDAQTFGVLSVGQHTAFLCNWHLFMCTEGPKSSIRQAQADLSYTLLDRILLTTYGKRTRLARVEEVLAQPLPAPKTRAAVGEVVLPMRPRFGQL